MPTAYPGIEAAEELPKADVERRDGRRHTFDRDLYKRIAKRIETHQLDPGVPRPVPPTGMHTGHGALPPGAFPGKPEVKEEKVASPKPMETGDSLAARARRMKREQGDR